MKNESLTYDELIKVVNKRLHEPNKLNDVYVGRGSCLGNPYTHNFRVEGAILVKTRGIAVRMYEQWLIKKIHDKDPEICKLLNKIWLRTKQGKPTNLVCYCKPKACHADIIRRIILLKLQ